MKTILVSITNYDFNDNASKLKRFFKEHLPTVLVDSTSPTQPEDADWIIPNTHYPGLWNKSVELAIEGNYDYLFFIASDIQFKEASLLFSCLREVAASDDICLWTPSLSQNSRFAFKSTGARLSSGMRYCGAIEGFCFLARIDILRKIYPLSPDIRFGYGVDIITALYGHQEGKVVADDRVIIYHPQRKADHQIDEPLAQAEYREYRSQFHFTDEVIQKLENYERKSSNPAISIPIKQTQTLDLGCGKQPKNPFKAHIVHGIDASQDAASGSIQLADLNIEPIPFASSCLDFVTAYDFLGHVARVAYIDKKPRPSFVELMNEIHRVLVPGGLFLSLTPIYPHAEAFQDPTHVNIMTDKTLSHYFCQPHLWSAMYGFKGRFTLVHQETKAEGKLLAILRCNK